ncbi:MAG: hypothetical protein QXV83_00990 [Candidatus Anstonellaceae archaeon]
MSKEKIKRKTKLEEDLVFSEVLLKLFSLKISKLLCLTTRNFA